MQKLKNGTLQKFLEKLIKELKDENNCDEAITGMALGVDTVFVLAVLELKEKDMI